MHVPGAPMLPLPLATATAVALFVLPLVLLAHWTHTAVRGREGAWFAFIVRAQVFIVLTLFADAPAFMSLQLNRLFASPGLPSWIVAAAASLAHLWALTLASRRVAKQLRGVTGEARGWRGTLAGFAGRVLPLAGMLAALVFVQRMEWRLAGASALTGFGLRLWLDLRRARVLGLTLEAVTSGPLRERVFALASHAGVRVEQLFVLAAGDARLVNAFAMQGRRVLLTDTLLEQLSRQEVEAVVAHELAHIKLRHPFGLSFALALASMVALLALFPLGAWGFALGGLVVWQVFLMVARAFEWAADRQAVRWTGDAGALVTALAAISRSNGFPLDWNDWTGLLLTHPSTRARACALERSGLLARGQAESLLGAPRTDDERWTWPAGTAEAASATDRVTGTSARMRQLQAMGWTSFTACVLAACAVVAAARALPGSALAAGVLLAGGMAGAGVMLWLFDTLAVAGYSRWRPLLGKRLSPAEGAHYVGFAPGEEPRLYEGFSDWDVGFLHADARGVSFVGERTRFSLPRERIVAIRRVPGLPGWFGTRRVALEWRRDDGTSDVFTVRDASVTRMHRLESASVAFAERLGHDLAGREPAGIVARSSGAPPDAAQVTSTDPRQAAGWGTLPALVLPLALLTCAAALLLGLPFAPLQGPGAWEVFVSSLAAALIVRLPYLLPRQRARAGAQALDRAA